MVRISRRRLIEMQRDALRVSDIEAEIRGAEATRARAHAEARAFELLADLPAAPVSRAEHDIRSAVLDELPLTAAGELHEEAFLAVIDARTWAHREQLLATLPHTT